MISVKTRLCCRVDLLGISPKCAKTTGAELNVSTDELSLESDRTTAISAAQLLMKLSYTLSPEHTEPITVLHETRQSTDTPPT